MVQGEGRTTGEGSGGGLLSEVYVAVAELLEAAGVRGLGWRPGCWECDLGEGWWLTVNGHGCAMLGGPGHLGVDGLGEVGRPVGMVGAGRVVGWFGHKRVGEWGPWDGLDEGGEVLVGRIEGRTGELQGITTD